MRKSVTYLAAGMIMVVSSTGFADGKAVYESSCSACHAQGVAGAPKFGDAAAWKDRIAKGMDMLHEHSIKGFKGEKGFMPPKGGFANLSDDEVKAAVDYMVKESGGK